MIPNLTRTMRYTKKEQQTIREFSTKKEGAWGSNTNKMKKIKIRVRTRLDHLQSRCAYCGGEFGRTSIGEIEHILPKSIMRYWHFSAHHQNLVLACNFCNRDKKGTKDTIDFYAIEYEKCTFKIVHPYFDDPSDHYDWANGVEVLIKHKSQKGRESIELFGLNELARTQDRASTVVLKHTFKKLPLSENQLKLLDIITSMTKEKEFDQFKLQQGL